MALAISPCSCARWRNCRQRSWRSRTPARRLCHLTGSGSASLPVEGLWKVAMTGGPAVSVVGLDARRVRGATWGEDGTIIYATGNRETGLQRVSADGGTVEVLTRPDPAKGEADHLWPELLPGGRAVLFTIWPPSGGSDNAQVAVLDLRTGDQRVLVRGGSDARYVSSGHLVFGAGGGLRSVPFDLQRLTVTGTPVPVVEGVATSANGSAECAISRNGSLIYVAAGTARRELVWVDRQGNEEALGAAPRAYTRARISPDSTRVALEVRDDRGRISGSGMSSSVGSLG